jgi:TrmH family RNA methyltransferase
LSVPYFFDPGESDGVEREVTSIHNKYAQYVRDLAKRKVRQKEEKFVAEGVRFVEETLRSGWVTESVVYSPCLLQTRRGADLLDTARSKRIHLVRVSDEVMERLSDTRTSQGVLAIVQQQAFVFADLLPDGPGNGRPLLSLALDGVQDPGNLGTLIRSAAAAGGDGVLVGPGTVDVFNPKTLRSTMGSIFALPVVRADSLAGALGKLKEAGAQVVVADAAAETAYFDVDLTGATVIVLGNEGAGVEPSVMDTADLSARIPLERGAESLNVGVAGSLLLYEAVRQRRQGTATGH